MDTPQKAGNISNSVTTCWLCHEALPKDLRDTTVHEGKTCHIQFVKNLKVGR